MLDKRKTSPPPIAPPARPAAHDAAQPVFCIIDPSLRDFIGHHHAYDEAVARGAAAAGYRAVTLAHSQVSEAVAGTTQVLRCFRRDMWGHSPLARHVPERWRARGEIYLANREFLADVKAGLRRVAPPAGSILFAHMIFRHQLPALAQLVLEQSPHGPLEIILLLRYQPAFYDNPACARAFAQLEAAAASGRRVRLASDSARLARELSSLTRLPIEVMPIPHTAQIHAGGPDPSPDRPLRFVTLGNARDEKGFVEILDAIRLLREAGELEGLEFTLQANDAAPDVQRAIDSFSMVQPPQVTLLRHALSPEDYEAELLAADVILVPYWREIYRARTSGVFLEAMAAGKIVIATRDTWMSDELARHGAGVLVDDHDPAAIANAIRDVRARLPALRRAARLGRTQVLERHNPDALIRQAVNGPAPEERAAADGTVQRIALFYPWGNLAERRSGAAMRCQLLLEKLSPLVGEIRVLHDGPYSNLPSWHRVGAAMLHLPTLAWRWVRHRLTPLDVQGSTISDGWAPDWRQGNVSARMATLRMRHHLARQVFRAPFRLLPHHQFGQERMLWFFLERHLDHAFRAQAAQMVAWADVVMLEYPIWADIVAPLCQAAGKRLIITNYDVLSQQVTACARLRRVTERLELRGMALASEAVCVSDADQAFFAAKGIATTVIHNPIDVDYLAVRPACDLRLALSALFDVVLPQGPVCLFVGSHFGPNIEAMNRVRAIALDMAGDAEPVAFVIAGDCAAPGRGSNWVALGSVDSAVLALLYHLAELVLVPLSAGTGSSIKTIEALAAGKAVLGTSIALRGLNPTPGEDSLLEDDFSRWPELIRATLRDGAGLEAIGRAARRLGATYDYRVLFDAYLPMIGLDSAPAPDLVIPARPQNLDLPRTLLERSAARGQFDIVEALLAMPELAAYPLDKSQLRKLVVAAGAAGRFTLAETCMARLAAMPSSGQEARAIRRLERALHHDNFGGAQRMLARLRRLRVAPGCAKTKITRPPG